MMWQGLRLLRCLATVQLIDSFWCVLQNDLQAMARCHRIGQVKEVKVYRLITSNTYEQNIFECSTRKQGAHPSTFPISVSCAVCLCIC